MIVITSIYYITEKTDIMCRINNKPKHIPVKGANSNVSNGGL